jgi:hypothetical protein
MHKFPSIEQFRSVIREVDHRTRYIGFEPKELSGTISNKARTWFFDMENKGVGL